MTTPPTHDPGPAAFGITPASASEVETLTAIVRELARAGGDVAAALDGLVVGACTLLDTNGACVVLFDDPDRRAGQPAGIGMDGSPRDTMRRRVASAAGVLAPLRGHIADHLMPGSLFVEAAATRRTLVSNDATTDPRVERYYQERFGVRSVLAAPLECDDRVLGVLCAVNAGRGAFDDGDARLAHRLADHGALALRNARLVDEATRARSRAEAAAALARSALTARDVRTGAGAMLAVLAPRVPCDGVSIHVVDGGASAPGAPPSMRCVAAIGALAHLVGVALPRPTSATLTDCAECEIAPGVRLPAADGATMAGTALLVPLVAHGRQIGDVCAFTRDAAPPTSVPETLVALAPTAALALDALLLNAERERAVLEERRLGEQLRQAERLTGLGELVAGLAHEINNPLTGIRALAELLLEEPVSAEVHESARLIRRETDRAARVVHDLMTFARDREPAVHRPVAVAPLLKRALRMRAPVHRERGIAVTLAVEPSLPPVHGDAGQLQQVMLNLLQNAEQAMQESSVRQLAVGARRMVPEGGDGRDGWAGAQAVVVSIADTGIGMDDATLTRIFDPFFTTRTAGGGAGLGMSVSYGIVQAHAGAILVRSTPGGGTTFDVVLPADGCDPTSLAEGDGAPPGFDRDGVPAPDPAPSSLHPTSA